MRCHSNVYTWLERESEYRPHRASIPRATTLRDMNIGHLIIREHIDDYRLSSRFVGPEERQWESKQLPVYQPYRAPSNPKVVYMNCKQCHLTVYTWLWEEREYHPHQAGISRASATCDMDIDHLIMREQIDGYKLSSMLVGPGESHVNTTSGYPVYYFSTRYGYWLLDQEASDLRFRFNEHVNGSVLTSEDQYSFDYNLYSHL